MNNIMNEVTLTLDKEVLKELIIKTIKEEVKIELLCNGELITANLMIDNEIIDTDTVRLDGGVNFY